MIPNQELKMPRSNRCVLLYSLLYVLGNLLGEAAAQLSYSLHCSSFVSEAAPDVYAESTSSPLTEFHTGYYKAGSTRVFKTSSSSFSFLTRQVLNTDRDGVLKIAAELVFRLGPSDGISILLPDTVAFTAIPNDSLRRRRPSLVSFRMEGFWEESSGNVCLVGSSYSRGGEEDLKLEAVLNLDNVTSSAIITSLFTGTFQVQKKDHHDFDAISVFMFPNMNYKYSLVTDEEMKGVSANGIDLPVGGLEPPDGKFCTLFETLVYEFSLTYPAHCYHSATNSCSPFGTHSLQPPTMLFNAIGCSDQEDRKELRVLLQFTNQRGDWSYDPNTTLIGEGVWDKNKNLVHVIACRVSMPSFSASAPATVNDCLFRLQFLFPAMWSIRDRNTVVGEMKKTNSSGDDSIITARSTTNFLSAFPDLNYEYTEAKRVEKFCLDKFTDHDETNGIYPGWSSPDLSFEFYAQDFDGKRIGSGFAYPLFVGKERYERSAYDIPLYESRYSSGNNTQFNISYSIIIWRPRDVKYSSVFSRGGRISGEGVYNVDTGRLCMVGCRSLVGDDSWDCEIGITVKFASNRGRLLKGSIESTREISDPLYFESVTFSTEVGSKPWVWRMHLELSLVLISNTFSCIFTALLFFHVRKHREEAISVMMITILALGHAVPLLLNGSNRYQVSVFLEAGKWLEVIEVMDRVIVVVTLFLELRLLQMSISRRSWWVAEKKVLLLAMPLYCVGGLLLNRKSFGGVVVDGFLLPQILVNILSEKLVILPGAFYGGTTLVRLVPHVYDIWRRRRGFEGSYVYGGVGGMDSSGWDVIIVVCGLVLGVIIYLQQRFGGQVVVPQRFRGNKYITAAAAPTYDKVPQEMTDV